MRAMSLAIPTIIIITEQAKQLSADTEMVLNGQRRLLFAPDLLGQNPPLDIKAPPLFSPIETSDGERTMMRASVNNRPLTQLRRQCHWPVKDGIPGQPERHTTRTGTFHQ